MKFRISFILTFAALVSIPALAGSGGPDGGGYYWYDQDYNTDWFTHNWVDISDTGYNLYISSEDDAYELAGTLSFDFRFYGTVYDDIYVDTNGTVYFENTEMSYSWDPIPCDSPLDSDAFMAPWWTDLDPGSYGGEIYFQQDFGDHFVVMFDAVGDWSGYYDITFEVIGFEAAGSDDSDIMFLYNSTCTEDEGDDGGAIGIQGDITTGTGNQDGTIDCATGDVYYYHDGELVGIESASLGEIKAAFK